ncbi:DEAD/DEAH box helicase [Pantoea allii]|uniref:DEAD/DEAH box helicase n=1 Tax=Pantoea allii TaxID=574096 RepID=UPI003D317B6F
MTYSINYGLVELNGHPLEPESLYRLGRFLAVSEGSEEEFVISKRPAELKFEIHIEASPSFVIFFKEKKLDSVQVSSLIKNGYFIAASRRIYFVTERLKEYVLSSQIDLTLPNTLKLIRKLHSDGLTNRYNLALIDQLRENQKEKIFYHNDLFVRELYTYQKDGVSWLTFCAANGVGTILADEMGLGKTAQAIALCCDVIGNNPESHILIVVPNPLLANWIREFEFFSPSLKPYLHYGPSREGLSSALLKYKVIITPYTSLSSDISMLEEISFDLILYDEASMLKNPHSGRTLAAKRLNTAAAVAMTGTPVENSLLDIWSICDIVLPGYLGNEQEFRSKYVQCELNETQNKDLEELEISIKQILLRRMKKDVLTQLPEKIEIHRAVTLTESESKVYTALIKEMQHDVRNGGGGILPLINKLQQFTAHPALLDEGIPYDVKSLRMSSAKFELLIMVIDNIKKSGGKAIIFATFHKIIDILKSAMKERYCINPGVIDGRTPNEERQALIDKFSASLGFDILLLHPRTAGMGLNITAATNVIHYNRQWNPALEAQATARAWRNGQKSIVSVYYMYYADTIEEMIDKRISLKQKLSEQIVKVADNKETDKQLMLDYLESLENDE